MTHYTLWVSKPDGGTLGAVYVQETWSHGGEGGGNRPRKKGEAKSNSGVLPRYRQHTYLHVPARTIRCASCVVRRASCVVRRACRSANGVELTANRHAWFIERFTACKVHLVFPRGPVGRGSELKRDGYAP